MEGNGLAVEAEGLVKRYGSTLALDGFDLAIPAGTVCGLLGPNGAGKTTAVRILSTLLRFDEGRAAVGGFDVARDPEQVRFRIGLTGQSPAVDEILTGRQNLVMFGKLFHLDTGTARRRADELLEQFGLTDAANKQAKSYSGGMMRRLDLAASFIMAPQVMFLDEPTTGQDPRNRNEVWNVVRSLVAGGTTVLLTTHYLDEADQLADQISVIDRGRVIANGTASQLKSQIGGDRIDIVLRDTDELTAAAALVGRVSDDEVEIDRDNRRVSAAVRSRAAAMTEVLRAFEDAGITAEDVALRQPTLDEVFLQLTGHRTDQEEVAA